MSYSEGIVYYFYVATVIMFYCSCVTKTFVQFLQIQLVEALH